MYKPHSSTLPHNFHIRFQMLSVRICSTLYCPMSVHKICTLNYPSLCYNSLNHNNCTRFTPRTGIDIFLFNTHTYIYYINFKFDKPNTVDPHVPPLAQSLQPLLLPVFVVFLQNSAASPEVMCNVTHINNRYSIRHKLTSIYCHRRI